MKINKQVYPQLESVHKELCVRPYYISERFRSECRANDLKFIGESESFNELFFNQAFKKIACRPFIYLFKGGMIYGLHGEWVSFSGPQGYLFKVVMENGVWVLRDFAKGVVGANTNVIPEILKEIRLIGLFKEFAEVKEKSLPPKGKIKDFNCKYKSDFDFAIGLLTENWYTESCQSHPFVVRGHWRWQACGRQLEDRKLIWIDSFMKDGYTKGAYKNKQ